MCISKIVLMGVKRFTYTIIGCLFLSISSVTAGIPKPSAVESTAQKDGFNGKVKTVRVYSAKADGDDLTKKRLLYSFRYDKLGHRVESYDVSSSQIYKKGYNKQGKLVRSSLLNDDMEVRMQDTIFVYDARGLLSSKRISSCGKLAQTEKSVFYASGEELSNYTIDADMDTVRSSVKEYHPTTGNLMRSREVSGSLILHDFRFTYDETGRLVKRQDFGDLGSAFHLVQYEYDAKGRVKRERTYRLDGFCVEDKAMRYYSNGTVKRCRSLKTGSAPGSHETKKGEWNLDRTRYTRKGQEKKYKHYEGVSDYYVKTVMSILEDDGSSVVYAPIAVKTKVRKPMTKGKFRYNHSGNCTKRKVVKNDGPTTTEVERCSFDRYGNPKHSSLSLNSDVKYKCSYSYDDHHNMTSKKYWTVQYDTWEYNGEDYLHYDEEVGSLYNPYPYLGRKSFVVDGGFVVEYEYW